MSFDVLLESAETVFPLIGGGVPFPTRKFLESALAVGVERSSPVLNALHPDP
jgi:hypothetical protein